MRQLSQILTHWATRALPLLWASVAATSTALAAAPAPTALPWVQVQGTQWVNAQGQPVALKGVNLGSWLLPEFWMLGYGDGAAVNDQCSLEAVLDQRFGRAERERLVKLYRDNWITQRDWDLIPQFGLNLVRLPFMWSVLEDADHPKHLRPDAWVYLDQAIDQAERHGLYVILDLHGAVGSQGEEHHSGCANQNKYWSTPEYQERTIWLWQEIAKRYKNRSAVAGYGLLNEPWGSTDTQLAEVATTLYNALRTVDTQHVIIFPGHNSGIQAYPKPASRGQTLVAYEMHFYPGIFGWGKPGREVHKAWLNCVPAGSGVCEWQARMKAMNAAFFVGEFQPWADMPADLAGPITRATYDRYAQLGWASAAWSYKKISRQGGPAPVNWGLVTNATGAPVPELDFRSASLEQIESFMRGFGSIPYELNAPVLKWMNSKEAPKVFD